MDRLSPYRYFKYSGSAAKAEDTSPKGSPAVSPSGSPNNSPSGSPKSSNDNAVRTVTELVHNIVLLSIQNNVDPEVARVEIPKQIMEFVGTRFANKLYEIMLESGKFCQQE